MCLAIPMTIIKIDGDSAIAESRGVETRVNISLMPGIQLNDRVIIHAGFVIEKLDPEEAEERDKLWDEYERMIEEK